MKYLLVLLFTFTCFSASAKIVNTNLGAIERMYAYDDFGAIEGKEGADVAVWMKTGVPGCRDGVWLSPSAPGYKMMVSFLLAAYTTNKTVRFQVYYDRQWPGASTLQLCQIDAIRFE